VFFFIVLEMLICVGKMWKFCFRGEFSSFIESSMNSNCSHWKHECVVFFYSLGNVSMFLQNLKILFLWKVFCIY
jgi:hypothetical protein